MPFIQAGIFAVSNGGADLARDIETGFLDRLALTPMSGLALVAGQLAGVVALGFINAIIYLAVGLAAGASLRGRASSGALVLLGLSTLITFAFGCIGVFAAFRFGNGEAVQGLFPVLFVFLFLSSMALPQAADRAGVVSHDRHLQPRELPHRGHPQPVHRRVRRRGAGARVRQRACHRRGLPGAGGGHPPHEAGAHMRSSAAWRRASAWRNLHNFFTNPTLIVPALLFPLFFFTAFAGGLSEVADVPGFDYPAGYTAFQFVFVLLQSSAFGGVFTGFAMARDFESGFGRRMMLAAPQPQRDHRGLRDGGVRARGLHLDHPHRDRAGGRAWRWAAAPSTWSASTAWRRS